MFGPSKRQLYRDLTRQRDHYEAVISDLHDRLANANSKPWTPAPVDLLPPPPVEPEPEWTTAPEQYIPIG